MSAIRAVVSDFGGVLTSPLLDAFTHYAEESGIPLEALGHALAALAERDGVNPLVELETGRMSEASFLDRVAREVGARLGRAVSLDAFPESYFSHLHANEPMIAFLGTLRRAGLKLALCTNNVREWEPLWRAKLPVDELFDVVVDSGFVGVRKPDPEIYEITLQRLGVEAGAAVLVDDVELNCEAAREHGMHAIWFRSSDQAIAELETLLGDDVALARGAG